jgi:hypothetical protein
MAGKDAITHSLADSWQVVEFANSLKDASGNPLIRSVQVSPSMPLPREIPDLVATTPAGLIKVSVEFGPYNGWEWTKTGVVNRSECTVVSCVHNH